MAVEELLAIVPPPSGLCEATEMARWEEVERAAETKLPVDYRDFGLYYGSGRFDDGTYEFWVINPMSPDYPARLAAELDLWRVRREAAPWEYPAPIFPACPGLLPWGRDEDGGMMGWIVEGGDPNCWPVVTKGHEDEGFERFDLSFTTFLARSLAHRLRPRVWRADYPADLSRVAFQPDQS